MTTNHFNTASKVLNQAQAEAVYSAMCALNNVGGIIKVTLPYPGMSFITSGSFVRVFEDDGHIKVRCSRKHAIASEEFHEDQAAFAAAYGLQQD